jgi:type I restriction enzyme, R subunit
MRPVNSMVEFKQIIGRGTRIFEGKDYFTIYDFVKAHHHFNDESGMASRLSRKSREAGELAEGQREIRRHPIRQNRRRNGFVIKLADGKERRIQHMTATNFFSPDGKLMSAAQFIASLYDTLKLPEFLKSEEHLREFGRTPQRGWHY